MLFIIIYLQAFFMLPFWLGFSSNFNLHDTIKFHEALKEKWKKDYLVDTYFDIYFLFFDLLPSVARSHFTYMFLFQYASADIG